MFETEKKINSNVLTFLTDIKLHNGTGITGLVGL